MITGFGNNVVSALAADITASQTTIQVMPGAGEAFARLLTYDYQNASNDLRVYAKITLTDAGETEFEVCHLTAVNNDMLTVVRGQEGTAAKGWNLNDVVANFATRGSENQFVQIEHLQSGHYTSGVAGGTANALTLDLPASYFVNGSTSWELRAPLVVYPSKNNTGPATLQLTMGGRPLGTFKLYKGNRSELAANDILKDVAMVCVLDRTKEFFSVSNPGAIYAGLGTAAFRDVQESRDDITPGRVLVNGGALALRTVAAKAGTPIADASALPANSVSFCYSDAAFSPGYEATILDVGGLGGAGYRVQYAASYADGGKRLKFRTLNADNGFWGGWTSVLTNYGGTVSHLDGATYYQANPAVWMGAGAFQTQYGSYAPFHLPFGHEVPQGVSQYLPLIKGVTSTAGYGFGAAVSFGILRSGSNDFGSAVIHILGDNGTGAIYQFGHDGTFYAPGQVRNGGNIFAGQGVFESGGLVRVYSSNNPPPQQDLRPYATQAWVAANFLQAGQRLASLGVATNSNNDNEFAYAPNGAVVTAVQQKTNYTAVQYRYVQYNINGNWYTAWVA
ncbi:hypothetical protein [Enterobacter sp. 214E4]|uniref:hypothetical protein n=1 Tax=Enterobacter sp. 214E4 TaxID=3077759 RepID=UPI002A7EFF83|nr:hypothetical protein [Enterobacter sp. 214E4]